MLYLEWIKLLSAVTRLKVGQAGRRTWASGSISEKHHKLYVELPLWAERLSLLSSPQALFSLHSSFLQVPALSPSLLLISWTPGSTSSRLLAHGGRWHRQTPRPCHRAKKLPYGRKTSSLKLWRWVTSMLQKPMFLWFTSQSSSSRLVMGWHSLPSYPEPP